MWTHQSGGAFVLRADTMGRAERALFYAVAQAVLETDRGDLRAHLARPPQTPIAATPLPALAHPERLHPPAQPSMSVGVPPLTMPNGIGGFADDGRTYAIVLEGDQDTPAPWVNVIANPRFGTILSASGSATTWSENSRENRLTPFANDPVIDHGGEALFIRDDDIGPRVVADAGTDAANVGERPHPDPSRGRPDALLAIVRRHSSSARGLRRPRGSGALRAAHARQHVAEPAAT